MTIYAGLHRKDRRQCSTLDVLKLLWMLGLALLAQESWASPRVGLLIYTHHLPPYTRQFADGSLRGTIADVVHCALRRVGTPYQIEVVPWARAQTALLNENIDGFFPAARSDERDARGMASKAIGRYSWAWFLPANNPADPESEAFRKKANVGTFHGSLLLQHLQQKGYRIAANPNNIEALVHMLIAGRLDGILAHAEAVEEILARQGALQRVRRSDLSQQDTFLYFNRSFVRRHPDFVSRFNAQLPECRRLAERPLP